MYLTKEQIEARIFEALDDTVFYNGKRLDEILPIEERALICVNIMENLPPTMPDIITKYHKDRDLENNVPLFIDHNDAANSMAALVRYNDFRSKMAGRSFKSSIGLSGSPEILSNSNNNSKIVLEPFAKQILKKYGMEGVSKRCLLKFNKLVEEN